MPVARHSDAKGDGDSYSHGRMLPQLRDVAINSPAKMRNRTKHRRIRTRPL